jgi:hypothetical protein
VPTDENNIFPISGLVFEGFLLISRVVVKEALSGDGLFVEVAPK